MSNPKINEIGNHYGALSVICSCKNKEGKSAWLCQCDCGWLKVVKGSDLRKGKITSCGCRINSRKKTIKNLIGEKYGRLTVVRRADEYYDKQNKKNVWECSCECGEICYKTGAALTSGRTKSCGCSTQKWIKEKKVKILKGQNFGDLIVLSDEWVNNSFIHKCQCKCGNIIYVDTISLNSGKKLDCGCLSKRASKGEKYIFHFLQKQGVFFIQEYTFPDLRSESHRLLRFDFAILKDMKLLGLIEYDGGQHLKPCSLFGGADAYNILHQHDLMKNEYCKKNNIPLLRLNEVSNFLKLDKEILNFMNKIEVSKVWNE